jgi:hypothetical protein
LKTQLGYRFLHKVLALHILFTFLSYGFTNGFETLNFFTAQAIVICISVVLAWLGYADIEHVTIDKEKEWIVIKDSLMRVVLDRSLRDISDMEWENKNTIYGETRYGIRHRSNKKAFVVTFEGGYEWYAEGSDYKNYFEIQGYLLTYCAKHQIIKIRPLEERKRASVRKRKRRLSR